MAIRASRELAVILILVIVALAWITGATITSRVQPGMSEPLSVGPSVSAVDSAADYGATTDASTVVIGVRFDPAGNPTADTVEVGGVQVAPLRPEVATEVRRDEAAAIGIPRPTAAPTATSGRGARP